MRTWVMGHVTISGHVISNQFVTIHNHKFAIRNLNSVPENHFSQMGASVLQTDSG